MTHTLLIGARVFALTALVGLVPAVSHAQEQSFSELTLKKTYLKQPSGTTLLEPGFVHVFTPTSIACPGKGDCAVSVEFDALVGWVGAVESELTIDGTVVLSTGLTTLAGSDNTYAMPRVVVVVEPGTHVVEVKAQSQYFGAMGFRSLRIDVFK